MGYVRPFPSQHGPLSDRTSRHDSIPTVLLVSAYMVRRWYVARRLRLHGIGKGGDDSRIFWTDQNPHVLEQRLAFKQASSAYVSPQRLRLG